MKILLTGGAGFIGSHVLDMYVRHHHKVVVVDNFRSGRIENINHLLKNRNVEFVFGDILDETFVASLPTNVDIINHQAAQLEITRCIQYPQEDLTSNILGTTNILEFAKRCKNLKLVVYASSAGVYGRSKGGFQRESDAPLQPHWVYGVSKYATELLGNIYSHYLNIPFIGLRYSIIYGVREWFGRVLTLFIKHSIHDKKIVVFGDGHEVRDYCHVKDVVRFHELLLSSKLAPANHIYNVSSMTKTTIKELAALIRDLSGCRVLHEDVKEGEPSKLLRNSRIRLPGNLEYLCQDNTKAKKELGWQPTVDFKTGIEEEFKWYRDSRSTDPALWQKLFY